MSQSEDGRIYRRLVVELPAEVAGVEMVTANLSMEGVQVACPQLRYELNAEALSIRPLPVTLRLGDGESASVACGVKYTSAYDDDVLLGLRFGSASEDAVPEAITRFLSQRGGPGFIHPVGA